MEFKGTKENWIIDEEEYFTNEFGVEVFSISNEHRTEVQIADVYGDKTNALIISKAPEMLEFLIELYEDSETFSNLFPNKQEKLIKLIKETTELNDNELENDDYLIKLDLIKKLDKNVYSIVAYGEKCYYNYLNTQNWKVSYSEMVELNFGCYDYNQCEIDFDLLDNEIQIDIINYMYDKNIEK